MIRSSRMRSVIRVGSVTNRAASRRPNHRCDAALDIREHATETPPELLARAESMLGVLLLTTGNYSESEAHLRRALAIREELQGAGQPFAVAGSLNNLAVLRAERGMSEPAAALIQRRWCFTRKAWGRTIRRRPPAFV